MTVVIRPATADDVEAIVAMGQRFVQQTSYGKHIPDDPDHLRGVTQQMLRTGVAFVAERDGQLIGMLLGCVYPHFLTSLCTAAETAWWVEPTARNLRTAVALMHAFLAWARAQGAVRVQGGSRHRVLDRLYRRLGFHAVETVFEMELR